MAFKYLTLSCEALSDITNKHEYPFKIAAKARPIPVLPLVGSTINPPGLIFPSASAASSIAMPILSFTDPPGFLLSNFT